MFVILMKFIAQFFKVITDISSIAVPPNYLLWQQIFLLVIFLCFILIFGIHSILVHREGYNESNDLES